MTQMAVRDGCAVAKTGSKVFLRHGSLWQQGEREVAGLPALPCGVVRLPGVWQPGRGSHDVSVLAVGF